ncbi:hypothetical protein AB6A40_011316 [Gnathostoma spinigerum]|uniref:Uncharacterized protein n=1 Tax=Gnathostoma spinigerum TaxID=75299 RepID=A0ABD6F461_9BILA
MIVQLDIYGFNLGDYEDDIVDLYALSDGRLILLTFNKDSAILSQHILHIIDEKFVVESDLRRTYRMSKMSAVRAGRWRIAVIK